MYNIFSKDQALFLEEAHHVNAHFLFIFILFNEVLPGLSVPKMLKQIFSADGDGGLRVCVGGWGVAGWPNDPYTFTKPSP